MVKNDKSDEVVLSVADQNQVNLLERRLLNFRTEIGDAKKELEDLEVEIEKSKKEKEYQALLKYNLEVDVQNLTKLKTSLTEETETEGKKLLEDRKLTRELIDDVNERNEILKNSEDVLKKREAKLDKDLSDFTEKIKKLEEDQAAVKRAKEILAKAIEDAK